MFLLFIFGMFIIVPLFLVFTFEFFIPKRLSMIAWIRVEAFVHIFTYSFYCDHFTSLNLEADDFFSAAFYA